MAEQTKTKPLVSAITIFLNGEKFIEEAIASVFAQTYDNWELLLVDDGSTDGSTAIAQRYAQQYPDKVRYLEHEGHQNRGMSATRNLGIHHAKGEYIALLDADDVWLPQKLERQVAILESHPEAKVVCSSTQYWYSWTGDAQDTQRDYVRELKTPPNKLFEPPKLLKLLLQRKALTPATCSVLIRREVFDAIGGFEELFRGMFEDQAFFTKVYLKVPVFVESNYWDRYRQHPNSTCSIAQKEGKFHRFKPNPTQLNFLNWVADYLSQQDINDTEVWQALKQGLLPYKHPILYFFVHLFQQVKYRLSLFVKQTLLVPIRRWIADYRLNPKP